MPRRVIALIDVRSGAARVFDVCTVFSTDWSPSIYGNYANFLNHLNFGFRIYFFAEDINTLVLRRTILGNCSYKKHKLIQIFNVSSCHCISCVRHSVLGYRVRLVIQQYFGENDG